MDSLLHIVSPLVHGICNINRDICNAIQHMLLKYHGTINENQVSFVIMLISPEGEGGQIDKQFSLTIDGFHIFISDISDYYYV
jgi:hypothetical protein